RSAPDGRCVRAGGVGGAPDDALRPHPHEPRHRPVRGRSRAAARHGLTPMDDGAANEKLAQSATLPPQCGAVKRTPMSLIDLANPSRFTAFAERALPWL